MTTATVEHIPSHWPDTIGPDWDNRPWGKPQMWSAPMNSPNPNLLATCEFKYHGIKIRGVKIFKGENGTFVKLPTKQMGERLDSVFYFLDQKEREQFNEDMLWLYHNAIGKRREEWARAAAERMQP